MPHVVEMLWLNCWGVSRRARSWPWRWGAALSLVAAALAGGCAVFHGNSEGACGDGAWSPGAASPRPNVVLSPSAAAPLYVARFDRDGKLCNPEEVDQLFARLGEGGYTDVYLVCPGWTQGWYSAVGWMESFLGGYERLRRFAEADPAKPRGYRPLYIGAVWPADVLLSEFPAPSGTGERRTVRADADPQALSEVLGTDLGSPQAARIRQALHERGYDVKASRLDSLLLHAATLTPPEQIELAECLLPLYGPQELPSAPSARYAVTSGTPVMPRIARPKQVGLLETDAPPLPALDSLELLEVWKRAVRDASADILRAAENPEDDASRARRGGLRVLELVRWAMRATELRVVKDRAYVIGQNGLGTLLDRLHASATGSKLHLIGHSFGCEALLAGLSREQTPAATPMADTLLLLQPAVSAWAFSPAPVIAPDVATGLQKFATAGAYRVAVTERIGRSVVVTKSSKDWFLAYYGARAIRRPAYEGQAAPDSWAGEGAGFAMMGATGVAGTDPPTRTETMIPISASATPVRYGFNSQMRLTVVDADAMVLAHGDVNEEAFWWLLANQVEE